MSAQKIFGDGARMVANRLRKNRKHLARWRKQNGIHCYRLYDADLPEYAVAVDAYEGTDEDAGDGPRWVHVQEYAAPKTIDEAKARRRLEDALAAVREVLEVGPGTLFVKVRRRQKGREQYEKLAASARLHTVEEGGHRFLVNFEDYLDTGLFLDHRLTWAMVQAEARGRGFLNLFAYTGSATVYAAAGGATATTTVDMSRTYLDWAGRNLALNGFEGDEHQRVQADCLQWLDAGPRRRRYGLIFLDPPSFSSSKRMHGTFDVQRDHVDLLRRVLELLEPDGLLSFSNNNRRFKMDREALPDVVIEEVSRATLPKDFERNPRIHNCWRIRRQSTP